MIHTYGPDKSSLSVSSTPDTIGSAGSSAPKGRAADMAARPAAETSLILGPTQHQQLFRTLDEWT